MLGSGVVQIANVGVKFWTCKKENNYTFSLSNLARKGAKTIFFPLTVTSW